MPSYNAPLRDIAFVAHEMPDLSQRLAPLNAE
ncbi:acyl-CoA dehydrogenase N-terminal domain-containing protein [Pseudomonas schmalbachii]|nr:acyl-CoA dehydrogenase N-terminal domain-containing protein [Pseudomonas schmalbachii]